MTKTLNGKSEYVYKMKRKVSKEYRGRSFEKAVEGLGREMQVDFDADGYHRSKRPRLKTKHKGSQAKPPLTTKGSIPFNSTID